MQNREKHAYTVFFNIGVGNPMESRSLSSGVVATYRLKHHHEKGEASGEPLQEPGDFVPVLLRFLGIVLN